MDKDLKLAYQYAPIVCQKVNRSNPRGDFITNVDFIKPGDLTSLTMNWKAVNEPYEENAYKAIQKGDDLQFTHQLLPYVYFSVVETHTHYFIMYAFYHAQDWEREDAAWSDGPRWKPLEHEHDLEGALIVVNKVAPIHEGCADAMLTIAHDNFYGYGNWKTINDKNKEVDLFEPDVIQNIYKNSSRYKGSRVNNESLDGSLLANFHIDEKGDEYIRPKVYIQGKGHGIRGDRSHWSGGDRIIRYCPSLTKNEEPHFFETETADKYNGVKLERRNSIGVDGKSVKEFYRYKLINIFKTNNPLGEPAGLWVNKDDLNVFKLNDRDLDCFIARESNDSQNFVAGSAKPPWSWDDNNDRHTAGELALQPAHIVYNYFSGLREFSLEYVRNPYWGKKP